MSPQKLELLDRLEAAIEHARSVTFVVAEDTGLFSIEDELVVQVRSVMQDALDLLRDVMELYDAESHDDPDLETGTTEDDFLEKIGAAISSELAAREVASLAFGALAQLKESFDSLEGSLGSGYRWVVATHADTGLRRVGKGLISVEAAMREYEGLDPVDRHWSDIRDSLEIRRLYGQLRRAILRLGEAESLEQLESHLRRAAHRINILRNREIYPFLRVYDRIPIRHLQKRIHAWLTDRESDADGKEQEGRYLWSDLTSFAELLAMVNNREDLRELDRQILRQQHGQLFDSPNGGQLEAHNILELEKLLGRDDELDRVLLDPERHTVEHLREPLTRLLEELNRPYEPLDESHPTLPIRD
ncbi:MAG: hypothetical protein MI919_01045 [Holophagales bacterium]|nr:hypothetical protein [Holophagales bacterium]